MKKKIAIIGENSVQKALCGVLTSRGYVCDNYSFERVNLTKGELSSCKAVVLPFPSKGDNISFLREKNVKEIFRENQIVVGGIIPEDVISIIRSEGIKIEDYFTDEPYVLKNAYLTVQGVLKQLLENCDTFLSGKTALVTGFGRIAKPLCLALNALGMKVYVAVRSDIQRAEAEMIGFDVLKITNIKDSLFYFDFIFNTVPFNIIGANDVKHLKNSSVYFEIASQPYGAVGEHFGLYGKKYVMASALPGKFFPSGVAENITDYLLRKGIIEE